MARLGAQLLMQAALEAEITEFLGRDRYQRAAACEDARPGSRNGYREVTVKTTAGPVTLSRPKLRGATEAFASRLFGSHVTMTSALETPGGVLHLHPRGLARYPEGGRRREDEPSPCTSAHSRKCQASSPMDSGLPPRAPRLWARRPCFSTTLRPARTRQEFPVHPVSSGDRLVPRTCGGDPASHSPLTNWQVSIRPERPRRTADAP